MVRHTQKVNYEAVERKDNYGGFGRIHTDLQKQLQLESHCASKTETEVL